MLHSMLYAATSYQHLSLLPSQIPPQLGDPRLSEVYCK